MSRLFEPARMDNLELRNRFVASASHESMAALDGSVTEELTNRYRNLAKGGVGLVVPGLIYVHPRGHLFAKQTGIHSDDLMPGLKNLTEAVHAEGGKIAFQLAHGGRQSPKKLTGQVPLAPSAFGRDPITFNKAIAAGPEEITEIVQAFGQAARRAVEAGADAVQLHCAHGYLLSQWLSPFFNRRTDEYGGSRENMFRLVGDIIGEIKTQTGEDYPILVKLNTTDFTPQPGITLDLAADYAARFREAGISALETSGGTNYSFHMSRGEIPGAELAQGLAWWMRPLAKMAFKKQAEPCRFEPTYFLEQARVLKPVLGKVPTILVGGVRTLTEMDNILAKGQADFISMARPFIREPFLVKRFKEGKADKAACISCNNCLAAIFNELPLRCYVDGLPN